MSGTNSENEDFNLDDEDFNSDDEDSKQIKALKIIDWCVKEGKKPSENDEYMTWLTQLHDSDRWIEFIHEQIEEAKIAAMVDKIVDWCVREGKNPYVDKGAVETMDDEMRVWWQQHSRIYGMQRNIEGAINRAMVDKITDWCVREGKNPYDDTDAEQMDQLMKVWWQQHQSVRSIKRNIENGIKEKIKKRNSNRKTVATALSLQLENNVTQQINQARRNMNNTGGGRKSKNTGKKSKNKKKHIMSLKIKKELKNLTKDWINSLPNKKIYSKKNVNKFIKTLKKKCTSQKI